jgi:signal transduction histidine kinase
VFVSLENCPMQRISRHLAVVVTVTYLVFSVLWILLSDRMLAALIPDVAGLTAWQTLKGWLFVALSGALIFVILNWAMQLQRAEAARSRSLTRYYAVLGEVNHAIVHERNIQALYARICTIIVERGGLRMAWIGLLDQTTRTVQPVAHAGAVDGYLEDLHIVLDDSPAGRGPTATALRERQHIIVNDLAGDPRMGPWRSKALALGYRASAAFPIVVGEQLVGALNLYAGERNVFDADEISLLDKLAMDIAFAVEFNAQDTQRRAFEQERGALIAQLEQRLHALTAIHHAAVQLQRLHTPDELAQEIIRIIEATLDYEYSAVLLIDPATQQIVPFAVSEQRRGQAFAELDRAYLASNDLRVGRGITGWVAQTGESVRLDDVSSDPRYLTVREGIGSELCVPLRLEDRVIGVVNVETARRAAYSVEDQTVLEIVASQIAVALHNAQLYDQVREYAASLEARVAERTADLHEAMQRAQAADQIKSAFLATMSHELRTPLNSIIGFSGVLLQGLAGPLNDEQHKQLGMVQNSAQHLLALINDVLDISKIEAGQLEVTCAPFDLRSAIETTLRTIAPLAQKKGLALRVSVDSSAAVIVSDRRRVEQILLNLLNNAVKFTERGFVQLRCRMMDDAVVIAVEDSGIGIRAEHIDRLFRPFQQVDSGLARRHEGTGLGLSICRSLAELLGGAITVASTWGEGSTFTVTLPRRKGEGEDGAHPAD